MKRHLKWCSTVHTTKYQIHTPKYKLYIDAYWLLNSTLTLWQRVFTTKPSSYQQFWWVFIITTFVLVVIIISIMNIIIVFIILMLFRGSITPRKIPISFIQSVYIAVQPKIWEWSKKKIPKSDIAYLSAWPAVSPPLNVKISAQPIFPRMKFWTSWF